MRVIFCTWGRQMVGTDLHSSDVFPVSWSHRPFVEHTIQNIPSVFFLGTRCVHIQKINGFHSIFHVYKTGWCGRRRLVKERERQTQIYSQKGSKVKLPRCRIPNKKFLVAKSLYLEGHFWLSICCHLCLLCPHSSEARGRIHHFVSETSPGTVWSKTNSNCSLHGPGA